MVKFLLDNAVVLEKMEIFCTGNMFAAGLTEQQMNALWFQDSSHYLLTFPKASPRAQIAVFRNLYLSM